MHRLFVALPIPDHIADPLLDLVGENDGLRWTATEQLHLTLRFIGEVDGAAAEEVAAALVEIRAEPFDLALRGLGEFHHRRSGVLWAGVQPKEPVTALAAKIERAVVAAGQSPETRAFRPHVTLARWSGPQPDLGPLLARHAALRSEPWPARHFTLFESHLSRHGAHHEAVATYDLKDTGSI